MKSDQESKEIADAGMRIIVDAKVTDMGLQLNAAIAITKLVFKCKHNAAKEFGKILLKNLKANGIAISDSELDEALTMIDQWEMSEFND